MRSKIVAANWKMNLDIAEAAEWLGETSASIDQAACDVILFPSFVLLPDLLDLYEGDKLLFGAQNCSHLESGAYTGEVSAKQLSSVGADFVIVGHSERRQFFGETNSMIKGKIEQAIQYELTPVFCCGEPLTVRNENGQEKYVKQQLEETLFSFSPAAVSEIIIAYEPIWAIGTGLNATPEQAQEIHLFIRNFLASKFSAEIADQVPILYGGSCNSKNAKSIFSCPDVDGGLVGGASLKATEFSAILKAAS